VQTVLELVKEFWNTWQTIQIDCGYGAIELLKQCWERGLFVNGTIMGNRVPTIVRMTAESVKNKSHGYTQNHTYVWQDSRGTLQKVGLCCWKDKKPVLILTNCGDCVGTEECRRRSKDSIIVLQRPNAIGYYNKFMGGVDLKDMRTMKCPITLIGQYHWWIHLYGRGLDETVQNGMILHNLATAPPYPGMRVPATEGRPSMESRERINLLQFKIELVHLKCGSHIESVPEAPIPHAHTVASLPPEQLVPILDQHGHPRKERCVYCHYVLKLSNNACPQTRACCTCCDLPYCCEAISGNQCHPIVHSDRKRKAEYIELFHAKMQKKNGNTPR